jgi:exoribonuclease-2
MVKEGFEPEFPPEALRELDQKSRVPLETVHQEGDPDLTALLWSSVDNPESRDLDQIEWAERLPNGEILVRVGIADVDAFVPEGSALDRHAGENAVTVYAGIANFPMLPTELSEGRTSLVEGEDRRALVTEMAINPKGEVVSSRVFPARVRNQAKLDYDQIGRWLEDPAKGDAELDAHPGQSEQIQLQREAAERLQEKRKRDGSLVLGTLETRPVIENGRVVSLEVVHRNPARDLIENLMVAANVTDAGFLMDRGCLSLQRVVRRPERWPRIQEIARQHGVSLPEEPDPRALSQFLDQERQSHAETFPELSLSIIKLLGPGEYAVVRNRQEQEGHFGLAAQHYSHSTAPNRRYADLVMQRLLKAAIAGQPSPYTAEELEAIATRCTERESAARKVERAVKKAAAAVLLSDRIGGVFNAIVTGVTPRGTFARLLKPPVEGRVMEGEAGLDVGDRVKVRLLATDPQKGFIDFALSR